MISDHGRRWSPFRRSRGRPSRRDAHGALSGRSGAESVAAHALMAAPVAHLVLDRKGRLLLANSSAEDLGIVQEGTVDPRVVEQVRDLPRPARRRSDGGLARKRVSGPSGAGAGPREWEVVDDLGQPRTLRLSATLLEQDLVLVTATDETAARHAEVVRRDFVANVSHELKSPVAAIGLLAEAVAEAADEPGIVREFAERMQRESSRLGTLIGEIIALSAIQDGTLDEVDLVAIDEVVAAAIDRCAVAGTAAGITIRGGDEIGAQVLGDRSLLATALGNLVENAVNYSEAGSTVTISRKVHRGWVEISVADTGIGIAPKDQRRVFERFFRADPARSRATGGTGLGLAIAKHVAANHGGSIRLFSRLGFGSTFTFRVPAADRDSGAGERPGTPPGLGVGDYAVTARGEADPVRDEARPARDDTGMTDHRGTPTAGGVSSNGGAGAP